MSHKCHQEHRIVDIAVVITSIVVVTNATNSSSVSSSLRALLSQTPATRNSAVKRNQTTVMGKALEESRKKILQTQHQTMLVDLQQKEKGNQREDAAMERKVQREEAEMEREKAERGLQYIEMISILQGMLDEEEKKENKCVAFMDSIIKQIRALEANHAKLMASPPTYLYVLNNY